MVLFCSGFCYKEEKSNARRVLCWWLFQRRSKKFGPAQSRNREWKHCMDWPPLLLLFINNWLSRILESKKSRSVHLNQSSYWSRTWASQFFHHLIMCWIPLARYKTVDQWQIHCCWIGCSWSGNLLCSTCQWLHFDSPRILPGASQNMAVYNWCQSVPYQVLLAQIWICSIKRTDTCSHTGHSWQSSSDGTILYQHWKQEKTGRISVQMDDRRSGYDSIISRKFSYFWQGHSSFKIIIQRSFKNKWQRFSLLFTKTAVP